MQRHDIPDTPGLGKGKLLLAEPFMTDPNFLRSVIMLCEYGSDGVVGFVINKDLSVPVNDVVDGLPEFKASLHYGGPVANDTIYYVHRRGDIVDDSIPIMPGLYWGGDYEKLKFLIRQELITPRDIRFFIGYAGWGPLQLEDELAMNTWMVTDMHANYLFKSQSSKLWRQVLTQMGGPYAVIAQMPEGPCLN